MAALARWCNGNTCSPLGREPGEGGRSAMDGKKFIGPCGKKGNQSRGTDKLIFGNGKLLPAACTRWGFEEGL